jgi:hypothetical protein
MCLIFAFPNQSYNKFSFPRVFEKFENRFAGQNSGLPLLAALADLAAPKIGFRQCIFWVFQNWPNGPGGSQNRVPPVYCEVSASHLQKIFDIFLKFITCKVSNHYPK